MSKVSVISISLEMIFLKEEVARIHRELYKKDFHDPDNHNDLINHLETDILECIVKGALGSIAMKKASGGDEIPAELFQILKDDVCTCVSA